jgi:hypothetical protein
MLALMLSLGLVLSDFYCFLHIFSRNFCETDRSTLQTWIPCAISQYTVVHKKYTSMLMQFKETRQLSMLTFIFSISVNKTHGLRKNYLKNKLVIQCIIQNEITSHFKRFFNFLFLWHVFMADHS